MKRKMILFALLSSMLNVAWAERIPVPVHVRKNNGDSDDEGWPKETEHHPKHKSPQAYMVPWIAYDKNTGELVFRCSCAQPVTYSIVKEDGECALSGTLLLTVDEESTVELNALSPIGCIYVYLRVGDVTYVGQLPI